MELTSKQYKEEGGTRCPFCGSSDIVAERWDGEGQAQEVSCNDCEKRWYDIYELKGYEVIS